MNFFAYRWKDRTVCGKSERIVSLRETPADNCFLIAPFLPDSAEVTAIPFDAAFTVDQLDSLAAEADYSNPAFPFPEASTTLAEHETEVEEMRKLIEVGRLHKGVAARAIVREGRISLGETFRELSRLYPSAFVFCFHTPVTGTWLGASPEILVDRAGNRVSSMSLAGTRPAGTSGCWDAKNMHEHNIVSLYLLQKYMDAGATPGLTCAETVNAGPVEHLRSRVDFHIPDTMPEERKARFSLIPFARLLSPTPALSGSPKLAAIAEICRLENFQRGYYGGYCGPMEGTKEGKEEGTLFVNLRSMRIERGRYCLFAGGGIVADSRPADEWEETERKASTLMAAIRQNNGNSRDNSNVSNISKISNNSNNSNK